MAHPTLCVIFFVSERADEASSTFAALERVLGCEGRLTLVHATETPAKRRVVVTATPPGWVPADVAAKLAASKTPVQYIELSSHRRASDTLIEWLTSPEYAAAGAQAKLDPSATLLVLGHRPPSTGAGKLHDAVLGSAASRIVGEALFPCLVVRTDLPPPPTSRAVAVAVSGHAHSRALAAWVASALLRPGDAVALLHSHKGPGAAQGCTAPAEGALRGAGFEPAVEALPGGESPGAGLATWCAAHPPTVLVVGSRGRGRLRPVAAHAVAHAPCPVVVVNGGLLEGPAGGGAAA